jgi:PKHD-type hydroxylase
MAFQSIWYFTDLPNEIITSIENDLTSNFESNMETSLLSGQNLDTKKRKSTNAWIPTSHWTSGYIWHYVEKANRENFLYDITSIDGESMQFTRYSEGEFYGWHNDTGLTTLEKPQFDGKNSTLLKNDFINKNTELVRKLSFVLQLSDPEDYQGGNLQLLDENERCYFAPRARGTLIVFDSRTKHRVLKVTKGVRKSLVGWVVGPRWK